MVQVSVSCPDDAFSEILGLEVSSVRNCSKKTNGEKEKVENNVKILIFFHARAKAVIKCNINGRKPCCPIANAFLGRFELIQPISMLKISKINCIFVKISQCALPDLKP